MRSPSRGRGVDGAVALSRNDGSGVLHQALGVARWPPRAARRSARRAGRARDAEGSELGAERLVEFPEQRPGQVAPHSLDRSRLMGPLGLFLSNLRNCEGCIATTRERLRAF